MICSLETATKLFCLLSQRIHWNLSGLVRDFFLDVLVGIVRLGEGSKLELSTGNQNDV